MDRRDIQAFAQRDWAAVERNHSQHWAEQFRKQGPLACLKTAQALFDYVREIRPDLPTEQMRASDLEHHIAFKQALDRAAHATKPIR